MSTDILSRLTDRSDETLAAMAEAKSLHLVQVTWVHHWSDATFSFRTTRPATFRFRSGEFVMIGLDQGDKPLLRAYSIVSPAWEEHLEFLSVKVPDGPLTSRLQHLAVGDHIFLGKKPTGTLVVDALTPATRLVCFATGTGLAPFLSVLRDPETHARFAHVVITHTVRREHELAYRQLLETEIHEDEMLREIATSRFTYYPTVTREPFRTPGRITDRLRQGLFAEDLALGGPHLSPADSRVMLCGSMAFNKEMAGLLEEHGFSEGSLAAPADYVLERAFVG